MKMQSIVVIELLLLVVSSVDAKLTRPDRWSRHAQNDELFLDKHDHFDTHVLVENEINPKNSSLNGFDTWQSGKDPRILETTRFDEQISRIRRHLRKPHPARRKSAKPKRASIHVVPNIKSKYPLATSFDKHGNINANWKAESRKNLKLRIDSPGNSTYFNEAYIMVKYPGNYFIYGQVFFHGQKHEMGHCLHVADKYKPCSVTECNDREVLCSRTAAGHPDGTNIVYNINTNYVGGVVYLKRNATVRLAIDVKQNINMAKSIELDTSLCYFGAFSV